MVYVITIVTSELSQRSSAEQEVLEVLNPMDSTHFLVKSNPSSDQIPQRTMPLGSCVSALGTLAVPLPWIHRKSRPVNVASSGSVFTPIAFHLISMSSTSALVISVFAEYKAYSSQRTSGRPPVPRDHL